MALYGVYWVLCIRSAWAVRDFYRPLFGVSALGAVLPVVVWYDRLRSASRTGGTLFWESESMRVIA